MKKIVMISGAKHRDLVGAMEIRSVPVVDGQSQPA